VVISALDRSRLPCDVEARLAEAWRVLETVPDPEVPVLSVVELGIVRDVRADDGEGLVVALTPTYSGCPAVEVIEADIVAALVGAGLGPVRIELRRAPAWTTDWIGEAAKDKLQAYGIVPPGKARAAEAAIRFVPRVPVAALACPRCGCRDTERISPFGSTACKALWRCRACREPFEHMKAI
jgi:ring-1,2-phenylacetyl-CoA epoxidase subunit PaaD